MIVVYMNGVEKGLFRMKYSKATMDLWRFLKSRAFPVSPCLFQCQAMIIPDLDLGWFGDMPMYWKPPYGSYPFLMPWTIRKQTKMKKTHIRRSLLYIIFSIHLDQTSFRNKPSLHTSASLQTHSIPALRGNIGDFIIHDMRIPMNQSW